MVAPAFGKHAHPTGHLAPIIVLSGSGIPEFVVGETGLDEESVFRMTMTVIMKSTRVVIKRKMANPSI
jgi:hypothetical protein